MIEDYHFVRTAAQRIAAAADETTSAYVEGRVQQEPAFTDRMLGAMESAMNGFSDQGIKWRAITLTDRGAKAQEKRHGADFMGVLTIQVPGFSVAKGFLAQAKLVEPSEYFSPQAYKDMYKQAEAMLELSPDSFIFLYSADGVTVVPAISVVSSIARNPHEFYYRSISRFYEEHFQSFIGDGKLSAPNIRTLDELRRNVEIRDCLYLEGTAVKWPEKN